MIEQECTLNIKFDLSTKIENNLSLVYEKMPGWIGYRKEDGIPFWFSYDDNNKSIFASIEPSGLVIYAHMVTEEWLDWKSKFKLIATQTLGFKVGEIELGEVSENIEWNKNKSEIELKLKTKKWWDFWK